VHERVALRACWAGRFQVYGVRVCVRVAPRTLDGLLVRMASLSVGPPIEKDVHLLYLGGLGRKKKDACIVPQGDVYTYTALHVTTATRAYNCSFPSLLSLDHSSLLHVCTYLRTYTHYKDVAHKEMLGYSCAPGHP
jgi:hypothetical protein